MILIGSIAVPSYSPGIGNEVTIKTRMKGSIQRRETVPAACQHNGQPRPA